MTPNMITWDHSRGMTTFPICHSSTASFDSFTTTYTEDILTIAWQYPNTISKAQLHPGVPTRYTPEAEAAGHSLVDQGNSIQKWPSSSTACHNHEYAKFNNAEGWRPHR